MDTQTQRKKGDTQPVVNKEILFRTSINLNDNFSNPMKKFFKMIYFRGGDNM